MKKQTGVLCIGELLIDFICTDVATDLSQGVHFEKQAGGAPANVCAAIVKLGGDAMFSGKVGRDPFGMFLKQTLDAVDVDTSMLVFDDVEPTTLAFVSLQADGERDFVFNRGADANLKQSDLDDEKFANAKIVHFGSATALLAGHFRDTYFHAMKQAKQNGQFTSFDPNYRQNLWMGQTSEFVKMSHKALTFADFAKVSEEELTLITGTMDQNEGLDMVHALGVDTVAVTLGSQGTLLSNRQKRVIVPSIAVKAIDSTGAGDAFVGAMLQQLAETEEPKQMLTDMRTLVSMAALGNKVGALVCTKRGAITALPTYEDIQSIGAHTGGASHDTI